MSLIVITLAVATGGGLGAVLRWATFELVRKIVPEPWSFLGTAVVNLTGCFAVGVAGSLAMRGTLLSPVAMRFVITGILGGFTTFSAFGLETVTLLQQDRTAMALMHVIVNVVAGLLLVWWGMKLAEALWPSISGPGC